MAAVPPLPPPYVQQPPQHDSGYELAELEALHEILVAERTRLMDLQRQWLLSQAACTTTALEPPRLDLEYTALLEHQNALLKQRVLVLEERNKQLIEDKASVLHAVEPSRPMNPPATSVLSAELSRLSEQCVLLFFVTPSNIRQRLCCNSIS